MNLEVERTRQLLTELTRRWNEAKQVYANLRKQFPRMSPPPPAVLDAWENIRRIERLIVVTIRNGQREGIIRHRGITDPNLLSPDQIVSRSLLQTTGNTVGAYPLADVTEERFERALAAARADGVLTRTHVLEKLNYRPKRTTADMTRWEQLVELADQGLTSHQIGRTLNTRQDVIVKKARELGITIRADKVTRRARAFTSDRAAAHFTQTLDGLIPSTDMIDVEQLTPNTRKAALIAVTEAMTALRVFQRRLKAATPNEENPT